MQFKTGFLKLRLLGFFILLLALPFSFAGGITHGGGDVIKCSKGINAKLASIFSFNFKFNYYHLADTFDSGVDLMLKAQLEDKTEEELLEYALKAIENSDPVLAKRIRSFISTAHWEYVSHVEEYDDDDIRDVPKGCVKKQYAVQEIETKTVKIEKGISKQLYSLDLAMFKIHEAFIHDQTPEQIRKKNTSLVRAAVKKLVNSPSFLGQLNTKEWDYSNRGHRLAFALVFNYLKNAIDLAKHESLEAYHLEDRKFSIEEYFQFTRTIQLRSLVYASNPYHFAAVISTLAKLNTRYMKDTYSLSDAEGRALYQETTSYLGSKKKTVQDLGYLFDSYMK